MHRKYWKIVSSDIRCPIYSNKTRIKIRDDTLLENFPLFCPKCKHEVLIGVKNLQVAPRPNALDFNISKIQMRGTYGEIRVRKSIYQGMRQLCGTIRGASEREPTV